MKYILYIIIGLLVVAGLFIAYTVLHPKSPFDKKSFKKESMQLEVEYSRPYKKGRLIFGNKNDGALVPYNEYWRTGANAATKFSTNQEIQFGDKTLSAGEYRLYTIPNPKIWKVIINEEAGTFFAISEPDYSKDVISIEVESNEIDNSIEQFTIDFLDSDSTISLRMRWDKIEVLIPIM
jgi:hypothetical protein